MRSPSKREQSKVPSAISDVHRAMADEQRRRVLYHLVETVDGATVAELEAFLGDRPARGAESRRIRLHHSTLPHLDASGIVTYDRDDGRVRYAGGSLATELLETTKRRERP